MEWRKDNEKMLWVEQETKCCLVYLLITLKKKMLDSSSLCLTNWDLSFWKMNPWFSVCTCQLICLFLFLERKLSWLYQVNWVLIVALLLLLEDCCALLFDREGTSISYKIVSVIQCRTFEWPLSCDRIFLNKSYFNGEKKVGRDEV